MFDLTDIRVVSDILKSRSGIYKDTPENRRLHRVGQPYGDSKKYDIADVISDKSINYDIVKQLTNNILNGTQRIDSLNQEEERGRVRGGKRNVEASIICKGIKQFQGKDAGINGKIAAVKRYELALEDYAKRNNCWFNISDVEKATKERLAAGYESVVYISKDEKYVVKTVDPYAMSLNMDEFLDNRISLYNYLFPEAAYEVLGFGKDDTGKHFFTVVKQPLIHGNTLIETVRPDSVKEQVQSLNHEIYKDIEGRIGKLNSEYSGKGNQYVSDDYIIEDAHLGNVMKTPNDNFIYIDVVPSLNTAEDYDDGKRAYGSGKIVTNGNK